MESVSNSWIKPPKLEPCLTGQQVVARHGFAGGGLLQANRLSCRLSLHGCRGGIKPEYTYLGTVDARRAQSDT